ncbi:hypothetical protein N5079_19845 [Planotetraspora sp. A-T 1434]|uniref:hypothetical protein n=1 Tax=Planotetraspora sp. A-T 1434 TaxID=2979219 RepID=UPI0021C053EB|nr:hypothetical protein [Planotetraspora sp. A-T 1434]MCT9932458.1 hypothetical protein [Planotetraspora sp. A-T 1434]
MADEPSAGELLRRIDGLTAVTAQLVTRTEYAADRRYDDRRFAEIEKDVAELGRTLTEEMKALRRSIDAAAEKRGTNARQAVYAGLLPAVLVLLGIAVQIWIALKGP